MPFYYYVILLCIAGNFTQENIKRGAKYLERAKIFSHLTHSNKRYDQCYIGPRMDQRLCNSCRETLHSLLAGCFYSFPGACETNSTPGVAQAKLISHSTVGWLKIAPREQAWERDSPKKAHARTECLRQRRRKKVQEKKKERISLLVTQDIDG